MRVEHRYPVAPPALFAVLIDPDFLRARSARFGGRGEPHTGSEATGVVVTVPRALPLDGVPGPLRRFIGSGELVQVDRWTEISDRRVSGTWTTDVGGVPIDLRGRHEITGAPGESRYEVIAQVDVRVPFMGRQLEKTVTEHLETLVRKELAFAAEWLLGGPGPLSPPPA